MNPTSPGIVHHPFRFHVGDVPMSGYGIALVMAFFTAWVVIAQENRRRGEEVAYAREIVLAAAIGALFGSKLSYAVLVGGPLFVRSGHTFWGGLVGGAGAYWLWARLRHVSFFRHLDVTGMAIAAGYGVGRTGCWAVGDDYGRPWNSRYAVLFPEGAPPTTAANMQRLFGEAPPPGADAATILAVHPTQLYETALGVGMFLILWRLRDHRHAPGWLFGLYCVLAGVERCLIEIVRAKPERVSIGLSAAQVIALATALVGASLMYARRVAANERSIADARFVESRGASGTRGPGPMSSETSNARQRSLRGEGPAS
jgi:phosphatidylglycerol:prolipoprotein diacylglycerol transferase